MPARDEGQRNGNGAEHGCPPIEEKPHENQNQKNRRGCHEDGNVLDRFLDVGCRPVKRGIDLDSCKSGGHCRQRFLHAAGHFERAGIGPLFDDQEQAGTVVEYRVADQRLVVLDYRGDVAKPQIRPLGEGDPGPDQAGLVIGEMCWTPMR